MKVYIAISRDSAGNYAADYIGDDNQAAQSAGRAAAESGRDAALFSKPIHTKRWPAVAQPEPVKSRKK
jgi:hypothetical protein